jgi:hypothetical protein
MIGSAQLCIWPELVEQPDRTMYLQSDGQFVCVDDADDTAIPYSIANTEAQARWPRKSA